MTDVQLDRLAHRIGVDSLKSKDTFDVWTTKRVKDISGVDLSKPFEGPLPQQLLGFGF